MSDLLLIAPMAAEERALKARAPGARVVRSGVGPRRARRAATSLATARAAGVAVAGFGGALSPELEPGELVVATELRARDGSVRAQCPGAEERKVARSNRAGRARKCLVISAFCPDG